ncbi:MAG TPA: hypothetical protein VNA68_00745 [Candidatus Dormibacteraeota bacterium]|nr:hypothetical protein [Candidatus Dormibacteraeota bacterium]
MGEVVDRSFFQEASSTIRIAIEAVRQSDTKRNKAVLALARHNAERIGYTWDSLPWRNDDLIKNDQAYFVMNAMDSIDMLIEAGFIDAEVPPEAIEYRRAGKAHHNSMFPG